MIFRHHVECEDKQKSLNQINRDTLQIWSRILHFVFMAHSTYIPSWIPAVSQKNTLFYPNSNTLN